MLVRPKPPSTLVCTRTYMSTCVCMYVGGGGCGADGGGGVTGIGGGLCGGEGVRGRWVWWSVGSGVIFLRFTRCPRTLWPYELSDPRDALLMPQGVSLQQGRRLVHSGDARPGEGKVKTGMPCRTPTGCCSLAWSEATTIPDVKQSAKTGKVKTNCWINGTRADSGTEDSEGVPLRSNYTKTTGSNHIQTC